MSLEALGCWSRPERNLWLLLMSCTAGNRWEGWRNSAPALMMERRPDPPSFWRGSSSNMQVHGLPAVAVVTLDLVHFDVLACRATKTVCVLSFGLKESLCPYLDTCASCLLPHQRKLVPCMVPPSARAALAGTSPFPVPQLLGVSSEEMHQQHRLSSAQLSTGQPQSSAGRDVAVLLPCHGPSLECGLPVGCCGTVTCQPLPDPPMCWEWGQAAGIQPCPGRGVLEV